MEKWITHLCLRNIYTRSASYSIYFSKWDIFIKLNIHTFCIWQLEFDIAYVFFNQDKKKKNPVTLTSLWTKCWDVRKILKAYHRMGIIGFYLGTNKQQIMTRIFMNSGSCHLVTRDIICKDIVKKSLQFCPLDQCLWDRGPVTSFFIRRGPGPNRFTCKYLPIF